MPRTIDAEFELVTRAYIGGADDGSRRPAALRVPSLLGVLRFWWRALEWGRVLDANPAAAHGSWDQRYAEPVKLLRQREDRLFGAAGQGQGLVLASLLNPRAGSPVAKLDGGAAYLAGQGLGNRDALAAETTFTLRFTVRPRRKKEPAGEEDREEDLASLARAVRCLGLLGGVGARSRRGFGSLALRSITDREGGCDREGPLDWQQPAELDGYRAELQKLNDSTWSATEPPFTAFSTGSRLTLIPAAAGQDAGDLLAAQGSLFQCFRSKGVQKNGVGPHRIGKFKVDTVNHRFHDDFAWFTTLLETQNVGAGPERAMFGLPHNYFSKSRNGRKAKVLANIPGDATGSAPSDRRASPLFLHIHRLGDGTPVAAWLFLPARFLPDVNSRGPQLLVNERPVNYRPRWCPILEFYTRLGEKPGHVCVWP